jgi:hypothetical protein
MISPLSIGVRVTLYKALLGGTQTLDSSPVSLTAGR